MVKDFSEYFPGLSQPYTYTKARVAAEGGKMYVAASDFELINSGPDTAGGAISIVNSVRVAIALSRFNGCSSGKAGGGIFIDPLGKENGLYVEKCTGYYCYTYSNDPDNDFSHQGQWLMAITNSDNATNTVSYCSIDQCSPHNYFKNQRPIASVNGKIVLENLNISNSVIAYCGAFYVDSGFEKISNILIDSVEVEKSVVIEIKDCKGTLQNLFLINIQHNTKDSYANSIPMILVHPSTLVFDYLSVSNCTSVNNILFKAETTSGDVAIALNHSYIQDSLSVSGYTNHNSLEAPIAFTAPLFDEEKRESEALPYLPTSAPKPTTSKPTEPQTPTQTPTGGDDQDNGSKHKTTYIVIGLCVVIVLAVIVVAIVIIIRIRNKKYTMTVANFGDDNGPNYSAVEPEHEGMEEYLNPDN